MFAKGSNYLMDLVSGSLLFQILFVVIFNLILIVNRKRNIKSAYVLLLLLLLLWGVNGRTIALFPDGRINSGWFYIPTYSINLCKDEDDCERVVYYETEIEKLPLWNVRVKNRNVDIIIFVGPLVWTKTLKLMENKFHGVRLKK